VQLDAEAWDRLITWIDLNAPCHGTWSEFAPISGDQRQRRCELRALYGGVVEDAEQIVLPDPVPAEPIIPQPLPSPEVRLVSADGWPFDVDEARRRQGMSGLTQKTIDLGDGVTMRLVPIPAGRFVMGDPAGEADERQQRVVQIESPFWMGKCEVTNQQYAQFDPEHDSRFEHRTSWIFSENYLGWPLNQPEQPVVRISCDQATAFCEWLSARTGLDVQLPTEAQWEYACRAGTASPFSYGDLDADFSRHANLADYTIRELAYQGWRPRPPDIVPRDNRFNDGCLVATSVGSYQPNPWGLCDMHGNVWEWTRSTLLPNRGDEAAVASETRVVRGGSWYDRPKRARASFRLNYPSWQRVFNVGFRVVCSETTVTRRPEIVRDVASRVE
jgi:formylglycine-generating enzyme required for sulfatase activity